MKRLSYSALILGVALGFMSSFGGSDSSPSIKSVEFKELSLPSTDSEITAVRVSPALIVTYSDGSVKEYPLTYQEVLKSGESIGGSVFGQILDMNGNPFAVLAYSKDSISYNPDANSIIKAGDKYYLITHFEEPSGMLYQTEIDPVTLKAKSTKPVNFSSVLGTIINCAGHRTPYGTHLGGEEDYNLNSVYADKSSAYYVDCEVGADGYYTGNDNNKKGNYFCQYVGSVQRYLGDKNIDKNNGYLGDKFNLYNYGYIVEVSIKPDGSYEVAKHYVTGKYTPEMALMMPDNKTVYMTDDGDYKGFYKLVLNQPQTSFNKNWCGTLYAVKLTQKDKANGGVFDVSWIKLGEGCDNEIKTIIDKRPVLSDIFQLSDPKSCDTSAGFKLIKEDGLDECIKLKLGSERSSKFASDDEVKKAAAFLETRKYAAYLGATVEFDKGEGLTFDPDNKKIYIAISSIRNGMTDTTGDIQLDANICGGVYALDLDANYNAISMKSLVLGKPLKAGEPYSDKYRCSPDGISNPDNLRYIGRDTLIIGEDTSSHLNNMIWAYNLKTGKLTRIATLPTGAEVTGTFEVANINGNYVIAFNAQHPFVDKMYNVSGQVVNQNYLDANKDKRKGIVGFLRGIPAGIFFDR